MAPRKDGVQRRSGQQQQAGAADGDDDGGGVSGGSCYYTGVDVCDGDRRLDRRVESEWKGRQPATWQEEGPRRLLKCWMTSPMIETYEKKTTKTTKMTIVNRCFCEAVSAVHLSKNEHRRHRLALTNMALLWPNSRQLLFYIQYFKTVTVVCD